MRHEVLTLLSLRPELLSEIEDEGLVRADEQDRFSLEEVERLRIIRNLVDDLGVNMAGVEVILQMRQEIREVHELFDRVISELVARLPR
jgi:MerR family transcriptional regulator/heat shock protein HspR